MVTFRQPISKDAPDMELILCPRQPGRLRISRHACALRYLEAQKMKRKIPIWEFDMARAAGLEICKKCPQGRENAASISLQTTLQGNNGNRHPDPGPK